MPNVGKRRETKSQVRHGAVASPLVRVSRVNVPLQRVRHASAGRAVFQWIGGLVTALLGFQEQGARFVFGTLVQSNVPVGTPAAGGALDTTAGLIANTGAFFAFNVLPTIIFFSALMSVLYYLGVMQLIVKGLAWVMQKSLGTSGADRRRGRREPSGTGRTAARPACARWRGS